jgi:hypothetical protein
MKQLDSLPRGVSIVERTGNAESTVRCTIKGQRRTSEMQISNLDSEAQRELDG